MQPRTLSVQIYEHVLRMILSGELAAGTPLREVELAERLGVSRTPVREALGRLSEYGVVEAKPNRGAVVRRLGREELIDIHQVREALEGTAAELACGRLTEADFDRLDALAEAAGDERSPGYLDAFDAFDVELHRLLGERSGNPILAREIRKLHEMTMLIHDQFECVLIGSQRIEPDERSEIRRMCWSQHLAIIDALKCNNSSVSRQAMVAHVRASCEYKIRLMTESGPSADRRPAVRDIDAAAS